jgi:hypothetical protein
MIHCTLLAARVQIARSCEAYYLEEGANAMPAATLSSKGEDVLSAEGESRGP